MSEHPIAWILHNYEMEQTIIRLRNTRNRLIDENRRLNKDNASLAYRLSGAESIRDVLEAMLDRICRDGFDNNDTISLEPYDLYILRKINELKEQINSLSQEIDDMSWQQDEPWD